MAITAGSDILASDFVSMSAGAGDSGKGPKLNSSGKLDSTFLQTSFGGDGSDGALSISSGTTTINLGGVAELIKNYTSISITGTGVLAFSNPAAGGTKIILKSQGNVTLTSSATPMIDASGMGGQGGASVSATSGTQFAGNGGSPGTRIFMFPSNNGAGGNISTSAASGGASTASPTWGAIAAETDIVYPNAFLGSGGGSGATTSASAGTTVSGVGGAGGGCLIIECGGAWNFTTASGISVAGKNGGNGVLGGSANGNSQGGGGGSGGFFMALYNTLTANSGTVSTGAGSAGTGSAAGSPGGSYTSASGGGGGGNPLGAGTNSGAGSTSAVSGGGGQAGTSFVGAHKYRL